jgi:hypothetical protein
MLCMSIFEGNITQYFDACISFVDEAKNGGGSCLVHCCAGNNLAAAICVAYVLHCTVNTFSLRQMARFFQGNPIVLCCQDQTVEQAIEWLQFRRAGVRLIRSFVSQLEELGAKRADGGSSSGCGICSSYQSTSCTPPQPPSQPLHQQRQLNDTHHTNQSQNQSGLTVVEGNNGERVLSAPDRRANVDVAASGQALFRAGTATVSSN